MDSSSEIDSIIEQLKADAVPATPPVSAPPAPLEDINDDNINDYIIRKNTEVIESALQAVAKIQGSIINGQLPEEINALSSLINASVKAIDSLNKINLQNKQAKNNIEMKKLDVTAAKNTKPATTNVLIATRDQIMSGDYKALKQGDMERVELIENISAD